MSPFQPTRRLTALTIGAFATLLVAPIATGVIGSYVVSQSVAAATANETIESHEITIDEDGTVDHDENLTVTGVKSGRYDAKFVDAKGRHCTVPNVEVKEGETFSLDENELPAACRK